jgi:hypothetical protein
MKVEKTIKKPSQKAVAFIKSEIQDKKKRHQEIVKSIDPAVLSKLQTMNKFALSGK